MAYGYSNYASAPNRDRYYQYQTTTGVRYDEGYFSEPLSPGYGWEKIRYEPSSLTPWYSASPEQRQANIRSYDWDSGGTFYSDNVVHRYDEYSGSSMFLYNPPSARWRKFDEVAYNNDLKAHYSYHRSLNEQRAALQRKRAAEQQAKAREIQQRMDWSAWRKEENKKRSAQYEAGQRKTLLGQAEQVFKGAREAGATKRKEEQLPKPYRSRGRYIDRAKTLLGSNKEVV